MLVRHVVHVSVTYIDNISHFGWFSMFLVGSSVLLFEKMDQRNCIIKFCVKNKIKFARTFKMFTVAFGESTMSRTQVQL